MKTNMKTITSLRFESTVLDKIKEISPRGNVNSFVNKAVKEYLEKIEREMLILAYKNAAKSTTINKEMNDLDGIIEDGIDEI